MYEHTDKFDNTRLTVDKAVNGGAVIGVKYGGIMNYLVLDREESVDFAEAVLKAAGSRAAVVKYSDQSVAYYPEGKTACGRGPERVELAKDADLDEVREVISNMVTLVEIAEYERSEQAERDLEHKLKMDRKQAADALGIVVPSDEEGLKALDEMVKRRNVPSGWRRK